MRRASCYGAFVACIKCSTTKPVGGGEREGGPISANVEALSHWFHTNGRTGEAWRTMQNCLSVGILWNLANSCSLAPCCLLHLQIISISSRLYNVYLHYNIWLHWYFNHRIFPPECAFAWWMHKTQIGCAHWAITWSCCRSWHPKNVSLCVCVFFFFNFHSM